MIATPRARFRPLGRLAGLALLAALPVGCGGTSSKPAASTPSAQPSSSAAPATPAAKAPASKAPAAAPKLTIKNFTFLPATVTVKPGATVRWKNVDSTNHTVTADKGGFDLGNVGKGASKSVRLTKPGVYAYHCNYHPSMRGRIVVK